MGQLKLEGTSDVLNALSALNGPEKDKLVLSSIRKAVNDKLVKPLRSAIPYSNDSKAIKVIKDKEFKDGYFGGVSSDAYWLRFIDKGTKERTTKSGANRGSIVGNHKITNFINDQINDVVSYFNSDFGPNLVKMIQRKLKRINK